MGFGTPGGGTMTGRVAAVKWFPGGRIFSGDHFNAAAIEGYTVLRTPERRWSVVGRVILSDAYKLAQRPLMFVAPTKAGELRWPIHGFKIYGDKLHAELGELDDTATPR